MPIEYRIDHERRLVMAKDRGILIVPPSAERMRDLARLSARMEAGASAAKFASVAPSDFAFGLGRMYGAYREMQDRSTKQLGVFRTMDEALAFLGAEGGAPEQAKR